MFSAFFSNRSGLSTCDMRHVGVHLSGFWNCVKFARVVRDVVCVCVCVCVCVFLGLVTYICKHEPTGCVHAGRKGLGKYLK